MKKQLIVLPVLLGSLLTAFSAQAANSVELKVKGTIVPPSCTPTFVGGNILDFGDIPAETLSEIKPTTLTYKSAKLDITCGSNAKVALKFIDNKPDTVVPGIFNTNTSFGLGTHAGKNIGTFRIYTTNTINPVMDGKNKIHMISTDLTTWKNNTSQFVSPGNYLSFGDKDVPQAFKKLSTGFRVYPTINKTSELPVTEKIELDGSVSLELHYI